MGTIHSIRQMNRGRMTAGSEFASFLVMEGLAQLAENKYFFDDLKQRCGNLSVTTMTPVGSRYFISVSLLLASLSCIPSRAQDWVHIGSNLGNAKIRIAAADFKPVGEDPQTPSLKAEFDSTLYSDLGNAGIFDLVSKNFAPTGTPGSPQEINLSSGPRRRQALQWLHSVRFRSLTDNSWSTDGSTTRAFQKRSRPYPCKTARQCK